MSVALILLAAGASSRMGGRDKLLKEVRGAPLLRDRAKMVLKSAARPVLVVLPDNAPAREDALDNLSVTRIVNPDAASGMASSIRAGLAALPASASATIMLPADMPNVTAEHLDLMIAAHAKEPDAVLKATGPDGIAKSPTLLPRAAWSLFERLEGDEGGRAALQAYDGPMRKILLNGPDPTRDLDTPEAWAVWRAQQNAS